MSYEMRREIREAIAAGQRARESLLAARDRLERAGNWGLFDLFGGDLLSGIMKHQRVQEASNCLERARADLMTFRKELGDLSVPVDFAVRVDSFLTFADFFFDGLLVDYLVQSKIHRAKEQVNDALIHVEQLLSGLQQM